MKLSSSKWISTFSILFTSVAVGSPDGTTAFFDFARSQAQPIRTVEWTSDDADMKAFGHIIGDAPLVGFGEADHGGHEQAMMRNRLFKYLVENKGYRAILLESGYIEGLIADRFVQGDPTITIQDALTLGFTHEMGELGEVRELLKFMRAYNDSKSDPKAKLHYIGFDLSVLGDSVDVPLEVLALYLAKVDPEFFQGEFQGLFALARRSAALTHEAEKIYQAHGAKIIDPDHLDPYTTIAFEQLDPSEQTALEAGVEKLVTRLEKMKAAYSAKGGELDYLFNSRLAFMAKQNIRNFRSRQANPPITDFDTVLGLLDKTGLIAQLKPERIDRNHLVRPENYVADIQTYTRGRDSRELMSQENITWAQETFGKALVFAHNGHLIKVLKDPDIRLPGGGFGKVTVRGAGVFLAERHGPGYVLIGSTQDRYESLDGTPLSRFNGFPVLPTQSCGNCLEKSFSQIESEKPLFVLDLKQSSGAAREYLDQKRHCRASGNFEEFYNPYRAYDAIFYVNVVTPSRQIKD